MKTNHHFFKKGLVVLVVLSAFVLTLNKAMAVELKHNSIVRIRHTVSGEYLTQAYSGERDDVRNVTVWPLPANKDNGFLWLLQNAGYGYWYIRNVRSGLVLTKDPQDQNVSDWGIIPGDPAQMWRFERQGNSYMLINKKIKQGLVQAYQGRKHGKRNVNTWPGQFFADGGWSWTLEDAQVNSDLIKIHFEKIRCIKPSTGQDAGTKVLFFGIDAALQSGMAAGTGGASAAGSAALAGKAVTRQAVVSAMKKAGKKELKGQLKGELKERSKNVVSGNSSDTAVDVLDLTSIEGLFNKFYGESPDQVEMRLNGISLWPQGGRNHVNMSSQTEFQMNFDYFFERSKGFHLQLVEYDSGSGDDWLGSIGLHVNNLRTRERFVDVLIQSEDEGSIYEITFTIEPFSLAVEEERQRQAQLNRQDQLNREHNRQVELERQAEIARQTEIERQAEIARQVELERQMVIARQEQQKQISSYTPVSARFGLTGSNKIPLNASLPVPAGMANTPAIYLQVTFADGSTSGPAYHLESPASVYFDEESGDPNDIIELINTDSQVQYGAVAATGNGVGTAYINVSFPFAPELKSQLTVEVIDTAQQSSYQAPAVPAPVYQQPGAPTAAFLNAWAADNRANIPLPYVVDVFEMQGIHSICPSGCEVNYHEYGLLVSMILPNHEQSDVTMENVDAQVGAVLGGIYCGSYGKEGNGVMQFAINDKNGVRVANTLFRPTDCPAQ